MSAKELAAKILADGWKEFVGAGIVVEFAVPIEGPVQCDDTQSKILKWYPLGMILPDKVDLPAKYPDYCVVELSDTKPGSAERIEKMEKLYAEAVAELKATESTAMGTKTVQEPSITPSAFTLTLDDVADRLATLLARGKHSAKPSADSIQRPNRKRKKLSE